MKSDTLNMYLVSMNEVENNAKGNWFSRGAMRFFKTRLPKDAYKFNDVYYFISSEQGPNDIRAYSIRVMKDGAVSIFGDFQGYSTKAQAKSAVRKILIND